jgi:hypothetical protein
MKVVMNLNDDLIPLLKDHINKTKHENMTSFINDVLSDYLSKKYDISEKIYEVDELSNIDLSGISRTSIQNSFNSSKQYEEVTPSTYDDPFKELNERAQHFSFNYFKNKLDENKSLKIHSSNHPLWGQINRIFPMKAALRFINSLNRNEDGLLDVSLFNTKGELAKMLQFYGKFLSTIDTIGKRGKSRKLSTSFPIGEDKYKLDKSTSRFLHHFVFELRKDNLVTGGLVKMNFIKLYKIAGEKPKVGVTDAGNKFAKLSNPILDEDSIISGKDLKQLSKMSDKEKSDYFNQDFDTLSLNEKGFILNHIKTAYPAELKAIKRLLKSIHDEKNSPFKLKHSMKPHLEAGLSDSALATVVNGLVSRCAELDLLGKTKEGLNVTYHVSNAGKSVININ